jgi:hypothetical protein
LYDNLAFVEGIFSVLYSTGLLERKLGRELDVTWGTEQCNEKSTQEGYEPTIDRECLNTSEYNFVGWWILTFGLESAFIMHNQTVLVISKMNAAI